MREVFLHIGLHKTATGALQRQLFPRCDGLNLLTTDEPHTKRFVELVTRKDEIYFDSASALEAIEPALMDDKPNLLSNESLSGPPYAGVMEGGLDHRGAIVSNLRTTFPDAKVLLVIRRQNDLARSLYRQYLKIGGTRRVDRFYGFDERGRPALMSLDRFRFKPYIDRLAEAFPAGLLVLPFEGFIKDSDGFLDEISRFTGVPIHDRRIMRENSTRLGRFGLEATRLLNHLFRSYGNPAGVLPGIPLRNRRGAVELTSPVAVLHDHWPSTGGTDKGEVYEAGERILEAVKADNRSLDIAYDLGLERYGYY